MAAFPEDDVLEVESAFGMAKPITPYRFQPTFADYQQRRRSQKDHPGARSKSSSRESSDTVTEVGGALNDTFPQPASAAPSCCSTDHEETRVGHTRWCSCGHCVAMTRKEDCSCCSEYPAIVNMRGSVKCVTEHYGFREVCLSRHVLLTAMAAYREFRCLPQQPLSNRYDKLVASAFLFCNNVASWSDNVLYSCWSQDFRGNWIHFCSGVSGWCHIDSLLGGCTVTLEGTTGLAYQLVLLLRYGSSFPRLIQVCTRVLNPSMRKIPNFFIQVQRHILLSFFFIFFLSCDIAVHLRTKLTEQVCSSLTKYIWIRVNGKSCF